ncbi:MAG TPA: hypothetical protein VMM92_04305, partial [Thermoanaerobaculia bacterium]|nr:hypothetical protein [Thermoanaerobaculia bacterium]
VYSKMSGERRQLPMKFVFVEGTIFLAKNPFSASSAEFPGSPIPESDLDDLLRATKDRRDWVRLGAVQELGNLLGSPSQADKIRRALQEMLPDSDFRVHEIVTQLLENRALPARGRLRLSRQPAALNEGSQEPLPAPEKTARELPGWKLAKTAAGAIRDLGLAALAGLAYSADAVANLFRGLFTLAPRTTPFLKTSDVPFYGTPAYLGPPLAIGLLLIVLGAFASFYFKTTAGPYDENPERKLRVTLNFSHDSWVKATADDEESRTFSENWGPKQPQPLLLTARRKLVLSMDDASAAEAQLNGQPLPLPGAAQHARLQNFEVDLNTLSNLQPSAAGTAAPQEK